MLKKLIQSGLILLFLSLIIYYFTQHQEELKVLSNVDLKDIGLLTFITLCSYLFYATAILVILKKLNLKNVSFVEWFKIFIISRFLNFHVTQGANLYRTIKLKKDYDFSYTNSINIIAFLAWFYTITTLLFCFGTVALVNPNIAIGHLNALLAIGAAAGVLFACPFWLSRLLQKFTFPNAKVQWIKNKVDEVLDQFSKNTKDKRLMAQITVVCALHFAIFLALVHESFVAIGVNLKFEELSLFTALLMISKYINIVPGNLGVTEYLCGSLAKSLGGSLGHGVVISGIIRLIDYALVSLLAIVFGKTIFPRINTEKTSSQHF